MAEDGRIISVTSDTHYSKCDVVEALQAAVAGGALDSAVRADLARALRTLGKADLGMVAMYAGGHPYRMIGKHHGVSERTARRHVASALVTLMEGMNGEARPARPAVQRKDHPGAGVGGPARL